MLKRRNDFASKAEPDAPPPKMGRPAPVLRPTVSRETAEIALHLTENPVWVDLIATLKAEVADRLCKSPVGAAGTIEREAARYELEALSTIENRLGALAAEFQLHQPADDLSGD